MADRKIRRVLLVEDDSAYAKLVVDAAKDAPCELAIDMVISGEYGIAYLRERLHELRNPHAILVLLDLGLPGMGGIATLAKIRADRDLAETPVIVLTGSERSEDMHKCYGLGANGFITKPILRAELVNVLTNICRVWSYYTGEV